MVTISHVLVGKALDHGTVSYSSLVTRFVVRGSCNHDTISGAWCDFLRLGTIFHAGGPVFLARGTIPDTRGAISSACRPVSRARDAIFHTRGTSSGGDTSSCARGTISRGHVARFLVLVALSRVAVSRACSRVLARRSDRHFASVVGVFLAGLAVILLRFAEISPRLSPLVRRVRPRFLPLFCLQFGTSVAVFFAGLCPKFRCCGRRYLAEFRLSPCYLRRLWADIGSHFHTQFCRNLAVNWPTGLVVSSQSRQMSPGFARIRWIDRF